MPEQPMNEKVLRLHLAVHGTRIESLIGEQTIVSWRFTHSPEQIEDGWCVGFDEAANVLGERVRALLMRLEERDDPANGGTCVLGPTQR